MKCLLCPYAVSAEDSPASLCSEQGGDQLHSCLGANIVPAAVAIGKKPKAELSKFRVPEKNLFKSAGIESDANFSPDLMLSGCHLPLHSAAAG